jgi:hypothetical protein
MPVRVRRHWAVEREKAGSRRRGATGDRGTAGAAPDPILVIALLMLMFTDSVKRSFGSTTMVKHAGLLSTGHAKWPKNFLRFYKWFIFI